MNECDLLQQPTKKKSITNGMKTRRRVHAVEMLTFALIAVGWPPLAICLNLDHCSASLGMQSGGIADSSLSASSSSNQATFGPQNARIRLENGGGGWCPGRQISIGVYEYLQIKLDQLNVITFVETQGRFGNGQGQEFTEQYFVEYQREDNGPWFRFRDRRGEQGNTNTHTTEMREMDPPTVVKTLRFVPYSNDPKTVCLRVELYGCPSNDGLLSYSMPQGERRGNEVDLYDFTYDGNSTADHRLHGGLGQLSDGEEGQSNFRLDPLGRGIRGYEWVGWKNDSFSVDEPLEIIFSFDAVRNFSAIQLHVNNMYHRDVRVFSRVTVSGDRSRQPVVCTYERDSVSEAARVVAVPLTDHIVGRTLTVQLDFDAKWMMISEVQFVSTLVVEDKTTTFNEKRQPALTTRSSKLVLDTPTTGGSTVPARESHVVPVRQQVTEETTTMSRDKNHSHNSVGNGKSDQESSSDGKSSVDRLASRDVSGDVTEWNQTKVMNGGRDSRYVVVVFIIVPCLLVLGCITSIVWIWRRRRYNSKDPCSFQPRYRNRNEIKTAVVQPEIGGFSLPLTSPDIGGLSPYPHHHLTQSFRVGDVMISPSGGGSHYDQQKNQPIITSSSAASSLDNENGYYAVSDNALTEHLLPVAQRESEDSRTSLATPSSLSATLKSVALTAARRSRQTGVDMVEVTVSNGCRSRPVQLLDGSTRTTTRTIMRHQRSGPGPREIPRKCLTEVEKLGHGCFGEISLARWQNASTNSPIYATIDGQSTKACSKHQLVAVASLSTCSNHSAVSEFAKQLSTMSHLNDVNVVSMLGVCTLDEPYCLVFDYNNCCDLVTYLQSPTNRLSHGYLVNMTSQIASGMAYLESSDIVHGDLAARNCLIDADRWIVKITNFGLGRAVRPSDYSSVQRWSVSTPVRWMAWESVVQNTYTTRSDVWSFAVTMWEVLGRASRRPYDWLTDEQVLDNCRRHQRYHDDDDDDEEDDHSQEVSSAPRPCILPVPSDECTREIYDMMCQCWVTVELERPTFADILMFLVRKNDGFRPLLMV